MHSNETSVDILGSFWTAMVGWEQVRFLDAVLIVADLLCVEICAVLLMFQVSLCSVFGCCCLQALVDFDGW
jgi:hypothetical protein